MSKDSTERRTLRNTLIENGYSPLPLDGFACHCRQFVDVVRKRLLVAFPSVRFARVGMNAVSNELAPFA